MYKRLDSKVGRYRWSGNRDEVKAISWKQFEWLMEGLEIEQLKAMPSGVKDIQLIELKDTISLLNTTISAQNELISSLQKMPEERNVKDAKIFATLPPSRVKADTLSDEQKLCDICGTTMVPIGHEVIHTELVYTEPKLERIEYIATTYGCPKYKDTEEPQFIKDEGLPALIPGSYASSSLAAHIMYSKYVMSLPLYRQEKEFEYFGVKLSQTSMAHWIIYCSENYFQPMYDYLHRQLFFIQTRA